MKQQNLDQILRNKKPLNAVHYHADKIASRASQLKFEDGRGSDWSSLIREAAVEYILQEDATSPLSLDDNEKILLWARLGLNISDQSIGEDIE